MFRACSLKKMNSQVPQEQSGALQIAADAVTDPVNQFVPLCRRWRGHPEKKWAVTRTVRNRTGTTTLRAWLKPANQRECISKSFV
jgi:hypothetical protein